MLSAFQVPRISIPGRSSSLDSMTTSRFTSASACLFAQAAVATAQVTTRVSVNSGGIESDAESSHRLTWAELLERVFAFDALTCLYCGGPRKLIAMHLGKRGVVSGRRSRAG